LSASRHPRPVLGRRYRYSKWWWRVLVHALDAIGGAATAAVRIVRPKPLVTSPRSILLVQLDHLGDAVLTTPMLPRLRAAYPDARIDVLASPSNRAVFEADPQVNRVHVAERNWFERRPAAFALGSAVWSLGRALRRARYDLGIDVRGDILSILVLALAGVRRRVGWAMGGGAFLLTDVAPWLPGRHEVESRLALLECLGIDDDSPPRVSVNVGDGDRAVIHDWLSREWPAATAESARIRSRSVATHAGAPPSRARPAAPALKRQGSGRTTSRSRPTADYDPDALHAGRFGAAAPLLAVHLGAGTAAKRWPLPHWRSLIDRFLKDGWRVIVVGGPDEASVRLGLAPHPHLRDWTGLLSLTQTTALLERADLFLGVDSGPAHLAASAGTPSIILFSGTNHVRQWRPWSRRALVLRHKVPCSPCHRKSCPLADHPCLGGLGPERVHRAARRWWMRLHDAHEPHPPL
jgi:ADP-heptose:LPS heptosyltransferase